MQRDRFEAVAKEWDFNPFIIDMFREFTEKYRGLLTLHKEMKLIDVGGGTGLIAFELAQDVESITIVDNSPAMVETAKKHLAEQGVENVLIVHSEIENAEFLANFYDGIYAHMSLHHIENIDAVFETFHTLVKEGGTVVIGDLKSEDGSFHGDEPVPHNGFDTSELETLLQEKGFSEVKTHPLKSLLHPGVGKEFDRFFLVAKK